MYLFILLFLLVFKWLGQVFIIFRGPRLLNHLFLFYRLVILNRKQIYNGVISKFMKVNRSIMMFILFFFVYIETYYCFLILFRSVFIIKSCGAVPFYRSRQEREGLRGFIELKAGNTLFVLLFLLVFKWLGQVFIVFRGPSLPNWLF